MKIKFLILILVFFCINLHAQNGLKRVFVEKYYVANKKDSKASDGKLKEGAITYRIYAEMVRAYRLQAVYGIPGHALKIATTTSFYNDETYGAAISNDIPSEHLKDNLLMLDSWVSVGAAAHTYAGIPKDADNEKYTIVNANKKVLQNDDPRAGVPLKIKDGLSPASPLSIVTLFGLDSLITIFGNQNLDKKDQLFLTENGSWASFGGSVGPDPETNTVLLAQLTTNGELSFELNLQIAIPGGGIQNYVAKNPIDNEIQFPDLIYPSEKFDLNKGSKL